ncbi:hypothetical protein PINS_up010275 [Pythium insidiosum]|nr:hypothetical protein PINS_up010275 [Pythium insidiosum]
MRLRRCRSRTGSSRCPTSSRSRSARRCSTPPRSRACVCCRSSTRTPAAALQLGVHSTYTEPRRVLFYNMGSTSLQVSVVEFSSQVVPDGFKKNKTVTAFQVLSKAWDEDLGGAKFDLRLAEHLAKEFSDKIGEDVRGLPRPMAKLRAQAKKTKIVLSANEQIPVVMQALYKDTDFFTSMTRSKFEELCADLFARGIKPVEQALERAGLTAADIDEVEIIGGGVRMPKIQQQLKEFFSGKDLGVHLNGDEAMALGAAFHAANLSNSFRVRHVGMTDLAPYAVGVRLVDLEGDAAAASDDSENAKHWVKRASLFTESSRLGLRKAVSFIHSKDISATFRYDKPSALPKGASSHIAKLNITGIEEFAAKFADKQLGEPKITLSFELDGSGIAKIAKAEATLEEEYEVEVEVKKEKKDKKKSSKKKKEDDAGSAGSSSDGEDSEEKKAEDEEPVEKVKQMKKKTHRAVLLVTPAHATWDREGGISVLPMSVTDKKDSMRMLREMEQADLQRRANLEAKNRLETFVYTARDTLSAKEEQVQQVTTSEQVEQLNTLLEETEDWLYDDGEKVDAAAYEKKIKALEKEFNAIMFRVSEKKAFPDAVNVAKEYAFSTKELMNEWVEAKPQVTEDERRDVVEKVEELESWLEESEKKVAATAAHEAPVVTSVDVEKKVQSVKKLVSTLSKKPKPKPAKTEEKNATDEAESKSETSEDKSADEQPADEKTEKKETEEEKVEGEDDDDDVDGHEEL